MHEVTIKKDDALRIIRQNKEDHKKIYEDGMVGYKQELKEILEKKMALLEKGEYASPHIRISPPSIHIEEYNSVIKMLELSVDEEVTLDSRQFRELIMDKWNWQRDFLKSNAKFSMTAQRKLLD